MEFILPDLNFEKSLWKKGYKNIVGIDEVGRGSWAGPLVAAGVIFDSLTILPQGIADSKLLKPNIRKTLATQIKALAKKYVIHQVAPQVINKYGLTYATNLLFRKIVYTLKPDYCLIDAFYIKHIDRKRQLAIKKGDQLCVSIAAASIIAKVERDEMMKRLHFKFPSYGFGKHKGYGTKLHQQAIRSFGFTKIHRTSYDLSFLFPAKEIMSK